ncbi:MAG: redox-sensing transcriptional repressor Rex [Muribaculaceae bacterium]|nr:redox-sensing transcriptional repressor Rex [Muribaculaceae bacterium]
MLDRLRDLIPEPALRRLPWYLAYVSLLRERGVEYVSSTGIARGINVDASQIAKDLSFLDIKGKTRIGYEVALLEHKLEEFLGFRKRHRAAIIGVGSLGRALMQDSGLTNYGLEVVAGFDVDPAKIGTTHEGMPVYDVACLGEKARELGMEIGIVTVPVEYAQDAADSIVEAGLKAIWNFTPYRIQVPDEIVVANTSIYAHLAVMYNRMLSR